MSQERVKLCDAGSVCDPPNNPYPLDWLYDSLSSPPVAGVWWTHTLDWLNDSLSSPPVAGVWWVHWRRCPLAAISDQRLIEAKPII